MQNKMVSMPTYRISIYRSDRVSAKEVITDGA